MRISESVRRILKHVGVRKRCRWERLAKARKGQEAEALREAGAFVETRRSRRPETQCAAGHPQPRLLLPAVLGQPLGRTTKYMDFSSDNAVEVLCLNRLDEGMQKKDPKAETYDAKDEKGNPVKYMKEWPGLVDEIIALDSSPAAHTTRRAKTPALLDRRSVHAPGGQGLPGGLSGKGLMESVMERRTSS